MFCGVLTLNKFVGSCSISVYDLRRPIKLKTRSCARPTIQGSNSRPEVPLTTVTTEKFQNDGFRTGDAYDFERATTSLTGQSILSPKKVTLVRHGLSSWNEEGRVQGSSNLSVLTETGVKQAERCRKALANIPFDQCFSSPISRAKSTAEVIWQGREEPVVFLDSLKEAHLFFLEGMKNGLSPSYTESSVTFSVVFDSNFSNWWCHRITPLYMNLEAVDAKVRYPEQYNKWREDPANFYVNGVYPIRRLWATARDAWREILLSPGENLLVITHKSILRALLCTALGLPPERFRAIDVNNGGISVFSFNKRGEAMLKSLNMTAHMDNDHTYIY